MDSGSIMFIVSLALLILMSAYFSATETAFSSMSKIRLKNLNIAGNRRAKLALSLSDDYDRLLSSILIGNNIVNILAASISTAFFVQLLGDRGVTVSTAVTTILILIFGEITPKSLAKESPEKVAMLSAPIIGALEFILRPVNLLFSYWKKLLSKVFKVADERGITEAELLTIVEEAEQDGGINQREGDLIRSAIEFDDREAVDILTPRVDVSAISDTATKEEIASTFIETGYSRLPVYKGNIDNIVGVLHHKDFHNSVIPTNKPVKSAIKTAVFITKSMEISRLLSLLQQTKSHMAIVTDEFGGTMGIVTLEDVLEELVGEIWDEHDEIVAEIEEIGVNEYKVLCSSNIDKMFEFFGIDEEVAVTSVSGWVIEELGRIPNEGDCFKYEHLAIRVSKTNYRRVLEIVVTVNENSGDEESNSENTETDSEVEHAI